MSGHDAQQSRQHRALRRPRPHHHTHWQPGDPRLQMSEEPQRRHVRPVRIIDHQQRRPPFPQTHHQPVQRVQHPERGLVTGEATRRILTVRGRSLAPVPPVRPATRSDPDRPTVQQPLEQRPGDTPAERLAPAGAHTPAAPADPRRTRSLQRDPTAPTCPARPTPRPGPPLRPHASPGASGLQSPATRRHARTAPAASPPPATPTQRTRRQCRPGRHERQGPGVPRLRCGRWRLALPRPRGPGHRPA